MGIRGLVGQVRLFSGTLAVFQGASLLSLDAKGRLSMPARYRDALCEPMSGAGLLTLTKHPHGCLMLFPLAAWEAFRARIVQLPMSAQWWKRIFLGNAVEVSLDRSGRLLIPPVLRQSAALAHDVCLLGMGEYFEVWDQTTYQTHEAHAIQGEMPNVFQDFSF